MVGQSGQIVANGVDSRLRRIGAFGEVAIEAEIHGIDVVRAGQGIGIGDVRRRGGGLAVGVAPEDGVAGAEHDVIGASATHEGLVEVIAHGVFVGEPLQNGDVSGAHVVEGHGIAAAVIVKGRGIIEVVDLVGVVGDDEGIEVAQAAGGILEGGVAEVAIGLLPHLKEAVRGVSRVGVVRKLGALQREGTVGQVVEILDARVRVGQEESVGSAGRAGGEQMQVAGSSDGSMAARRASGVAGGKGGGVLPFGEKFSVGSGSVL